MILQNLAESRIHFDTYSTTTTHQKEEKVTQRGANPEPIIV